MWFGGLSHWCAVNPCMWWEDYLLCSPITHMQMFAHDLGALKELQLASVTLKDSILAQLNRGQVGKKVFFFLSASPFKDQ